MNILATRFTECADRFRPPDTPLELHRIKGHFGSHTVHWHLNQTPSQYLDYTGHNKVFFLENENYKILPEKRSECVCD